MSTIDCGAATRRTHLGLSEDLGEKPAKLLNPSKSIDLIVFPSYRCDFGLYHIFRHTVCFFGRQGFEATPGGGPSISGLLPLSRQEIKLDKMSVHSIRF